ncbi:MAG: DNA-3-methyladenine glycosylase 2 family protein [Candidatus Marinimicrobia bacterium]|nr:DNA-3-methyladenine glycosylase 2 family protein [Candidatus Neomarinimicrobiota bacterium]
MQKFHLKCNGPIDLAISCLPYTENRADRKAFAGGFLYRALRIDQVPALLKVQNSADDELDAVVVPAGKKPLPRRSRVEQALRRKLSLDLDLPAFYRFLARDPALGSLAEHHRGLRPILKDSLLEALSLAVADQQVNVTFAAELKHRLLTHYGDQYELDGIPLWLFPDARTLAKLDNYALRPLQYTRNKSSFIVGLARTFLADPAWNHLTGTDESIVQRLCQLRGVGRWTAEYGAMMGLGITDTLPAADIALMRMVQRVANLPDRPTEPDVRAYGARWSPWQGLVTFYLWREEEL